MESHPLHRKLLSSANSSCGFTSPHPHHQPPHQDSTLSLATNRWAEGGEGLDLTCCLYEVESTHHFRADTHSQSLVFSVALKCFPASALFSKYVQHKEFNSRLQCSVTTNNINRHVLK